MSEHIADLVSREDLGVLGEAQIRALIAKYEISENFDPTRYVPPGPVAQSFILSDARTSIIMGPLGGGKTTTCVFKRIYAATRAPIARHPEDGKPTRMCRAIVLRDTFRSAEKTVLESWKGWFPKTYPGSSHAGGNDRPFVHKLRFIGHDGIRVEAITEFAGLNHDDIETLMKGREYSIGWLNELDTHAAGAIDDMEQRVGRYPMAALILGADEIAKLEQELGRKLHQPGNRLKMVIGDMNAPTIDNWTYETLVVNRGPDRVLFQQPSGLSEDAENLANLEPDYYQVLVRNQPDHVVQRMVHNKFGYSRKGKPVHALFDHRRHVSQIDLEYKPGLFLGIGIDVSTGGLSPAAMLGQALPVGRMEMLDELSLGHGVGAARFAEGLVRLLNERWSHVPKNKVRLWLDPAAQYGGDTEGGVLTAMEIIATILGLVPRIPANGSNELSLRLGAVDTELRGYFEPDTSMLVSRRCVQYISGLAGGYRFKKLTETNANEYSDVPEKKHPISDLQDGGQYLILGERGHRGVISRVAGQHANDGEGRGWGSQNGAKGGWGRPGSFDPHKAGA